MDCNLPGSSVHGILQARYWRGLPFPPPGDLPDPVIEPKPPALQADSSPSETPGLYLLSDECPPFSLNGRSTMFQMCVNNSYQDLNTYPWTESPKSLQRVLRHTERSIQLCIIRWDLRWQEKGRSHSLKVGWGGDELAQPPGSRERLRSTFFLTAQKQWQHSRVLTNTESK